MIKEWQFILVVLVALCLSKIGKVLTYYEIKGKAISLKDALFKSGGAPSDHSAAVVSITALIGLTHGLNSALFAISAVFAAVVLYDACHVRLSVGLQAEALAMVLKKQGYKITFEVVHGHRLMEVVIGSLVGVFSAVAVFLLF